MAHAPRSSRGWYADCIALAQTYTLFTIADQLLAQPTLEARTQHMGELFQMEATNSTVNHKLLTKIGLIYGNAMMDELAIPFLNRNPDTESSAEFEKSEQYRERVAGSAKQALWALLWLPEYCAEVHALYKFFYREAVIGWRKSYDKEAKEILRDLLPQLRKSGEGPKLLVTLFRTQGAGAGLEHYEEAMSEIYRYRMPHRNNEHVDALYMVLAHAYVNVLGPAGLQPIFPKR